MAQFLNLEILKLHTDYEVVSHLKTHYERTIP